MALSPNGAEFDSPGDMPGLCGINEYQPQRGWKPEISSSVSTFSVVLRDTRPFELAIERLRIGTSITVPECRLSLRESTCFCGAKADTC